MDIREKLVARVTPLLEPGEEVRQVFIALGGGNPWLTNGFGPIFAALLVKPRIIAVTDRAVVVLQGKLTSNSPTKVLARLPRSTRIGPVKGVWAPVRLADEKLYVARRFHKDVEAADGAAPS